MLEKIYLLKDSLTLQLTGTIMIIFILGFGFILLKWQKSETEKKIQKKQLEIAVFYGKQFSDLVDISRKKQHEFKNQIDALYGIGMLNEQNDIAIQKSYYHAIEDSNKILKILNCVENPVLAGFVYKKICDISDEGIKIEYNLAVTDEELCVDIFDIVEMTGILLDNAQEAVSTGDLSREIFLEILCYNQEMKISIKNVSKFYDNDEISQFFRKNYTTKGENRGIGLDKIKDLQKKYKFDIMVEMEDIHDMNWISFSIIKSK